jgi:glucokinase
MAGYTPFRGMQRADDMFSTRGLLVRLREHGIDATDIVSALRSSEKDPRALSVTFTSFYSDLGAFLRPFVSDFGADAVLVTGGIAGAWEHFVASLRRALSVPVLKGTLGTQAGLLGAAALYF